MKRIACKVCCFKVLLCLLYPVSRIRKLLRKMKQLKIIAVIMLGSFFILTYLLYLNWNKIIFGATKPSNLIVSPSLTPTSPNRYIAGTPMKHMALNEIYPDRPTRSPNDSYEFEDNRPANMIDTPGCKIPVHMINYERQVKSDKKYTGTCGKRAVFLKKVDVDKVQALIKPKIIKKYLRKSVIFDCCYRFLSRPPHHRYDDKKIKFTKCAKFEDSAIITLETDFINVQCFDYDRRNVSHIIYDDVYAFAKRITHDHTDSQNDCRVKYNVLMIGMDSMSLPRFAQTMSRTIRYFHDNSWLGYRAYHKVADNTFPNLMALLTGKNLSEILYTCANKMDQCHNLMIWNKFKEAGYVTGYGEDYIRTPDTFTNAFTFKTPPTDHYMRPFYVKGETELNKKTLICAGKTSSGQQLLNYALDFANTYRSDQFFGLFWMNSFSHNANSRPQDADVIMENFFNQLAYTGVLKNTFVIALSDHGIRFGERRMEMESYYDERIPHLFISIPSKFIIRYPLKVKSLSVNQFRLTTPYDLHHTLLDINEISSCKNDSKVLLNACPQCHSLFDVVNTNRTCQDISIPEKWCSCHNLYPLPVQDSDGVECVHLTVFNVKQIIKSTVTKRCWSCIPMSLKNIIRIHFYYHEDKTSIYYVVAFTMTPGNVSYEATVLLKEGKRQLIGPISIISPYRGLGKCTVKHQDRLFCLCQKNDNC